MNKIAKLSALVLILQVCTAQEEDTKQKRMICTLVDADEKNPIKIGGTKEEGLKVIPFSFSGASNILQSAMPFLKNLPRIDSPEELPAIPIQTDTQNVSVTCDVVTNAVNDQIKALEEKVKKLTNIVEGMEDRSACPGGITYLDRCFRLMEIRGKRFSQPKSEDLCNFNGGVLAKLDNPLVYARVMTYVHDKFQDRKYKKHRVVSAWTGMKYHLATVGIGPFTKPGDSPFPQPGTDPFGVPGTGKKEADKLNEENKFLTWLPGNPKESLTSDRIAIQMRFEDPERKKLLRMGAITTTKWRQFVPLCQFQMDDWHDSDSVSARLFRFNF